MVNDERQKALERLVAEGLKKGLGPGGADCPEAGVIAAYVDRTLAAGERAQLESHLVSCRRCQEAVAVLVRLSESDEPAIVRELAPRRSPFVFRWAWAAPVLLAVIIVGVWSVGDFRQRAIEQPSAGWTTPPAPQPPQLPAHQPIGPPATSPVETAHVAGEGRPSRAAKSKASAASRTEISAEESAEAPTQAARVIAPPPAPKAEPAAADQTTRPAAGAMAPLQTRARLAAAPSAPGEGGGVGTGAGVGSQIPAAALPPGNAVAVEKRAAASKEAPARMMTATTGALARNKAVASPPEATGTNWLRSSAQSPRPPIFPWFIVTPRAGTWRVGPAGALEKVGEDGHWVRVETGVTADLYNLAFFDASVGWVVGQAGTVLRTTDGGRTWTPVKRPATADLTQVTATSALAAQVTARDGSHFATTDGGQSWTPGSPQ